MGIADSIQEAKLGSCKVVHNMSSPQHHCAFLSSLPFIAAHSEENTNWGTICALNEGSNLTQCVKDI
jgi:hypothetical protein